MTVDTPFPERPGTPFWDYRGGPSGMGDVTPLSTTTGILDAIAAGAVAADRSLNLQTGGYCPAGMIYNPQVGGCQPGVSVTASAGGNGMVLLLIAGAVLFFLSRGR